MSTARSISRALTTKAREVFGSARERFLKKGSFDRVAIGRIEVESFSAKRGHLDAGLDGIVAEVSGE